MDHGSGQSKAIELGGGAYGTSSRKQFVFERLTNRRASHRTVYGIRPYSHGTVTGDGWSVYRTVKALRTRLTTTHTAVFIRLLTGNGISVYRPCLGKVFCQTERIRYPYDGTRTTVLYGDGKAAAVDDDSGAEQLGWNLKNARGMTGII
ncbi:uncharacterized protein EV420DRAFT_1473441 [Desarmillaria tabescens]|uniref:Uncharacterized protein n=1 Tax=Armillaria tabescens TaxID=1929756 RepID=A0AA39NRA8_ARMTA|nr:uncharacterized protein EV420DRAFT_1473441 [Desarmillaria tabescens]KAK0470388.1 hypothetical protein EV420DRAFT_1473441 [Desarmillaria tabescens]